MISSAMIRASAPATSTRGSVQFQPMPGTSGGNERTGVAAPLSAAPAAAAVRIRGVPRSAAICAITVSS
jgi:hypothetical protein